RLVLDVVRDLVAELNPERLGRTIGLDDSLTRELALGSLERVELLLRLEQATGGRLDEAALADADSPLQLLAALPAHTPTAAAHGRAGRRTGLVDGTGRARDAGTGPRRVNGGAHARGRSALARGSDTGSRPSPPAGGGRPRAAGHVRRPVARCCGGGGWFDGP